jgi:hypothetical protein
MHHTLGLAEPSYPLSNTIDLTGNIYFLSLSNASRLANGLYVAVSFGSLSG